MQAGSAARRGVGTLPGRGRMEVLLTMAAVLAVAAVVALMVWVVPLATSGVGAEEGEVKNTGIMRASMVKDMGQMRGAGSAVVHDDAGTLRPR